MHNYDTYYYDTCVTEHLTHQGLNPRDIENFSMLPLYYYVMTMMLSIMSNIFLSPNYKIIDIVS